MSLTLNPSIRAGLPRRSAAWIGTARPASAPAAAGPEAQNPQPNMEPDTLLVRFSAARAIPPELAAAALLRAAIPPWKRPLFALLDFLSPRLFRTDREIVAEALQAQSEDELRRIISYMHSRVRRPDSFARDVLGIRVSGQRLLRLALPLFQP
jgi:hypothetical protein